MTEQTFLIFSPPVILAMIAILLKFVLLCKQAREEEFAEREKAVALAEMSQSNKPD